MVRNDVLPLPTRLLWYEKEHIPYEALLTWDCSKEILGTPCTIKMEQPQDLLRVWISRNYHHLNTVFITTILEDLIFKCKNSSIKRLYKHFPKPSLLLCQNDGIYLIYCYMSVFNYCISHPLGNDECRRT